MATAVFAETVDNFQYLIWLTPENKKYYKECQPQKMKLKNQSF
jgi:hypothetical protein